MEKTKIRKIMLERLKRQTEEEKERRGEIIRDILFGLEEFKRARTLLSYVSLGYEVDTRNIIKESLRMGKVVAVPVTMKKDKEILPSRVVNFEEELTPSNFGILEPRKEYLRLIPREDLDVIIVPGLAFDKNGARIGHGGGYYDRLLKTLSPHTKTIGLAFNFQILERLPVSSHDIPVSRVLSNEATT